MKIEAMFISIDLKKRVFPLSWAAKENDDL
jgi:hypothetical protein